MKRFVEMALAVLATAAGSASAEEITLTTYYPSPRGVYEELRTTNNAYLATLGGRVGIGTTSPDAALDIETPTALSSTLRLARVLDDPHVMFERVGGGATSFTSLGMLHFNGIDSAATVEEYARVGALRVDGTDGAEQGALIFSTRNAAAAPVERLRLTSSGVGIGATSPNSPLQIGSPNPTFGSNNLALVGTEPDLVFSETDQGADPAGRMRLLMYNNGLMVDRGHPAGWFGNPGVMYLSGATGNVGIGTSSPTRRLDVHGDIHIYMAPTDGGLLFGDDNPVDSKWHIGYWEPSILPPAGGLVFTESGIADHILTMKAGGNIGIGTSNPQGLLHTYTAGVRNFLFIDSDRNGDNPSTFQLWGPFSDGQKGKLQLVVRGNHPAPFYRDAFDFSIWDGAAWRETMMRFNRNGTVAFLEGNVGIGTPTPAPAVKLDVAGPTALFGSPTCPMVGFKDSDTTLLWGTTTCPAGWHVVVQAGSDWYWDGVRDLDSHIVLCCPP